MCAVRPERFTREFLDAAEGFSLTVFDNSYRKMLGYCGTVSGRDQDKVEKAGLTVAHAGDVPYFEECRMAFVCRKLCVTPLKRRISSVTKPSPKNGTAVKTMLTAPAADTTFCTSRKLQIFL